VGLLPIWPKPSPENTAESSIYASELWRLFATLDGSGIHRFTTDKVPGVSGPTLFGGRDKLRKAQATVNAHDMYNQEIR
jgi:hypothetical protein